MATRFAGSRSLDERRRRRLATEFEAESVGEVAAADSRLPDENTPRLEDSSPFTPTRLPLNWLISPTVWKHVLTAFAGIVVGGLIVTAGFHVAEVERVGGPALANLVDFESGDLVSMFCAISLFFCGQLSLLIWWVRSRSSQDFSGRYRIWTWASLFSFIAAFAVATDLHHVWTATLLWTWEFGFWKQETLLWLAPAVGSASALILEIKREFRDCRGSIALFAVSILAWSASTAMLLFEEHLGLPETIRIASIAGATMLGYFSLMMSLLVHARHVIYITAEPPQERPSMLSRVARKCIPSFRLRVRLPRRRVQKKPKVAGEAENAPPADPKPATTVAANSNETKLEDPKPQPKSRKKPAKTRKPAEPKAEAKPTPSPAEPAPVKTAPTEPVATKAPAAEASKPAANNSPATDEKPPQSAPTSSETAPSESAPSESTTLKHRIDDPIDASQLKGLSKKERRRLRKEHRERQRATQGGKSER